MFSSFGIVLWELWTFREPYDGLNYHALLHQLTSGSALRPTIPGASDWEGDVPARAGARLPRAYGALLGRGTSLPACLPGFAPCMHTRLTG